MAPEIQTEDEVPELPPVLPEEELDDLEGEEVDYGDPEDDDDIDADADDTPRPRRPKKRAKRRPAPETIQKQIASKAMDVWEWLDALEHKYGSFEQPGVYVQLERLAPQYAPGGHIIGGLLDRWESRRKPTMQEIVEEWGGGDFRLKVQIHKKGAPPRNLSKTFTIGHAPRVKSPNVPPELGGGLPSANTATVPGAQAPVHPIVEKRALDLVGDVLAHERKQSPGGFDAGLLRQVESTYRATTDQVIAAAELRAREREAAASRQVEQAEMRANEARAAAELAKREAERLQQETAEKVARATQESQSMLGLLLPTFNENAARQVDSISQTYLQREARIEQQHAKEVEALYRQHDAEIRSAHERHQAEMTRLETLYTGQLQMIQLRVQQLDGELTTERNQNNILRNEMMKLRAEETSRLLKQADPIAKLQEFGSLREMVGDILPGMGGGDGEGLSDDAPDWMKMINSVAGSLGPAIGQIMEARQQAGAQQLSPQQLAMLQYQQMLQAQAGGAPQLPPRPPAQAGSPQAVAATRVTFDRSELEPAVQMLSTIRNAGTSPADAAGAATKHVSHAVLRELARRTPEKVVDQLEAAGIMPSDLRTDDGRAYVVDFLTALRQIVK